MIPISQCNICIILATKYDSSPAGSDERVIWYPSHSSQPDALMWPSDVVDVSIMCQGSSRFGVSSTPSLLLLPPA